MKPFVAITVLVAASLSAASAASVQQQQVARGSQAAGGLGQSPLLSGGSVQSSFGAPGFVSSWSAGPLFNGHASGGFLGYPGSSFGGGAAGFPGSPFGGASSASPSSSATGAASRPSSAAVGGGFPGQVSQGGNYGFSSYPVAPGYGYYYLPQTFYPNYGSGASWGQFPAQGGSLWGFNGNYGYGGVFPAGVGQVSYGSWGGPNFGGFPGQQGATQRLAAQGARGASRSRSSSSQSQARRQ